jgi:hypothetical protein
MQLGEYEDTDEVVSTNYNTIITAGTIFLVIIISLVIFSKNYFI